MATEGREKIREMRITGERKKKNIMRMNDERKEEES